MASLAAYLYDITKDVSATAAALAVVAARKLFSNSNAKKLGGGPSNGAAGSRSLWLPPVPVVSNPNAWLDCGHAPAHACVGSPASTACSPACGSVASGTSVSSASSQDSVRSAAVSATDAEANCKASSSCDCAFGLPGLRAERVLGEGACGVAWLATQTLPDGSERQVVVKRTKPGFQTGPGADMRHEAEVMRVMQGCPHAVQLYDVTADEDGSTCLVMQYGSRASLEQELDACVAEREACIAAAVAAVQSAVTANAPRKELAALRRAAEAARCRMVLSRRRLAQLARSMLLALQQLHGAGYMHLDVKPDNIFIDHDGNYMLGDFGISVCKVNGTWPWLGSSPLYAADEVQAAIAHRLPKREVTQAADLPSLALTLAAAAVYQGNLCGLAAYRRYEGALPGYLDADLVEFIEGLLLAPALRPSIEQALAHPFVRYAE